VAANEEPDLVAATAVAARAIVSLADLGLSAAELAPPHPAFVAFRRMAYVVVEGNTLQPVGDRIDLWLAFLREQGCTKAALRVDGGDAAVLTAGPTTIAWRAFDDDGHLTMRGVAVSEASPPPIEVAAAHAGLAEALRVRDVGGDEAPAWEAARETALAILESPHDGSEVSDVAWPSFVLPSAYPAASRRLLAAALVVWPQSPTGRLALGQDDVLCRAVMAAVNAPLGSAGGQAAGKVAG
jgi:hypothetical protein